MILRKIIVLVGIAGMSSCVKEADGVLSEYDNNKVNLVVADNFNLSAFSAALRRSAIDEGLQHGDGPYTLLAPSDVAFAGAGYNSPTSVLTGDGAVITRLANYHTLDGAYELNKLPFLFNQELRSRGGKLYATHWVKGTDTILTINGSRVLSANIPASNGIIQVIDRVLEPYIHNQLGSALAADPDITLFAQAVRSSGLLNTINGAGPFTIFAPNNKAMTARGYTTVEQILATDAAELTALVNYHVVRDRRFVYDYILSTGSTNTTRQAMLNGNTIDIKLVPDRNAPGSFNGISLRGIGNTSDIITVKQNILTGNGVLHIIDGTLREVR